MTDPFDELEAQLRRAVAGTASQPQPAGAAQQRAGRWLRRAPLLVLVLGATAGGVALAAATLLQRGDPVPADARDPRLPGDLPLGEQPRVIATAPDPDGGLPWGLAVVHAPGERPRLTCRYIGRTQGGLVGVVGSDGAFGNDGRFHPLDPSSTKAMSCGGGDPSTGQFILGGSADRVPASGYSGDPEARSRGRRITGCTIPGERGEPGRPTCSAERMRTVKSGFAGGDATSVTWANRKLQLRFTPPAGSAGAYLFVTRPSDTAGGGPMRLSITYAGGERCTEPTPEQWRAAGPSRVPPQSCPRPPKSEVPQAMFGG